DDRVDGSWPPGRRAHGRGELRRDGRVVAGGEGAHEHVEGAPSRRAPRIAVHRSEGTAGSCPASIREMRLVQTAIGALLLAAAVGSSGAPGAVAGPETAPKNGTDLSFPGGGSILFMPTNGWSLGDSAFGIVTSTGGVHG